MSPSKDDKQHVAPARRDRADFVIGAPIEGEDRQEQLWVRQLEARVFEVCCIPFFVYDLALGDQVETDADYTVTRVVRRSGHRTLRCWFGDVAEPDPLSIELEMVALGATVEAHTANLVAIDATDNELATVVEERLAAHETAGRLLYENTWN